MKPDSGGGLKQYHRTTFHFLPALRPNLNPQDILLNLVSFEVSPAWQKAGESSKRLVLIFNKQGAQLSQVLGSFEKNSRDTA